MRTTLGPARLTVWGIDTDLQLDCFRIVRSDNPDDPVFLNSFRSHFELSQEPRHIERDSTVIHMGISVYSSLTPAHLTAQKWPKIGDYIAHLVLKSGRGFGFAQTGHPQHLTVWGEPIKLSEAVADISPVSI